MKTLSATFGATVRIGPAIVRWLTVLLTAVCSAAGAGLQSTASSQAGSSSQMGLQVALGFSGTFRLDHWTPLSVVVDNRGSAIAGYLEVMTGATDATGGRPEVATPGAVVYRQPVHLGRGAKQRFRFTVHLDNFAVPLLVRVRSGGREITRHTVDLRRRFTDARLLVVVSRDADLDYLNDSRGRRTRVVYPHPELLPGRWRGYDGAAAVVVHGVSLEALSKSQFDALEQWIEAGGTLVVGASADFSIVHTPRLAGLLPGLPAGTRTLANGEALGRILGEQVVATRPFSIHAVDRFRGRARAATGAWPLIVEEARGRGRVIYLTFDVSRYPFADWRGLPAMWLDLLRLGPPPKTGLSDRSQKHESLVIAAIEGGALAYPGHLGVVAFLSFYLCLLLLGYATSAGVNRTPLGRLIPLAPLVFAPFAYAVFSAQLFTSGAKSALVTVIEPLPGSAYALMDLSLALFANRRVPLRWRYAGAAPLWRGMPPAAGEPALTWTFEHGSTGEVIAEPLRMHRLHLLQGQALVPFSLRAQALRDGDELELRVDNRSGADLRAAWLIHQDRIFPLAPMTAGHTLRQRAALAQGIALDPWPAEQLLAAPGLSRERDAVAKVDVLRAVLARRRTGETATALFAGLTTAPLAAVSGAGWSYHSTGIVVQQVAVEARRQRPEEVDHGVGPDGMAGMATEGGDD
ncbi:MAG: hypothetical protein GKR94_11020 [Gammaproteobacteria bacterium]|nr:hypothetical protein [Gammaproteobacteria bacterium]